MVVRIPSGTQYSRYDIIVSVLKRTLLVSFIPQRVCDHALSTVRVVKLAEVTLGQKLITTKNSLRSGLLICTLAHFLVLRQYVVLRDGTILVPAPKLSPYSL